LYGWIAEKRAEGVTVDGVLIIAEGFNIAAELRLGDFRASRGWLYRFYYGIDSQ
jgi:hypothetical protein